MSRRRRRFSPLGLLSFVAVLGLLLGGSIWLDRRGETARAVVTGKHEEVTVHHVPQGGWDRWYRVGVEFATRDGSHGMATLTLPRERFDALRPGDSVTVHYPAFFPFIARAADRTTAQAIWDAGRRVGADPFVAPLLLWLLAGAAGLWLASRIATVVVPVVGVAWVVAALAFLFPAGNPPPGGPAAGMARVQGVTLITKAPARHTARRRRIGSAFGDVRRLAVPYQVVQLLVPVPGRSDSLVAVDAVDSGSVAGLAFGATVPIRLDPHDPRGARLAGGRRTFLARNRYHLRIPMVGVAIVGMLAAWGARAGRARKRREPGVAPPALAGRQAPG
jgi:hypothetical protein